MMRAISLWQPWASAMAFALKRNETRGWPTEVRGEVAICSSRRKMDWPELEIFDRFVRPYVPEGYQPVYGAVVCVVNLLDCIPTAWFTSCTEEQKKRLPMLHPLERNLGNYEPVDSETGRPRYAFLTGELRTLPRPVPVIGHQGFFFLPPDVEAKVREQI